MDIVMQRRIRALAQSAETHARNAAFQNALAEIFEGIGDDAQARTARELAELYRLRFVREMAFAG